MRAIGDIPRGWLATAILALTMPVSLSAQEGESNSMVYKYFGIDEYAKLHPPKAKGGAYHDLGHSITVGDLALQVTRDLFVAQVGYIHDIDPSRTPGSPARVPATLAWMEAHRADLMARFTWSADHFTLAKALVQRTEFPFDTSTREKSFNDYYGQKSPVQHYKELLLQLPDYMRPYAVKKGQALTLVDQIGCYTKTVTVSLPRVSGLAAEFRRLGRATDFPTQARETAAFLRSIGQSGAIDQQIAREVGLPEQTIISRKEFFNRLTPRQRANFDTNLRTYEEFAAGVTKPGSRLTAARATRFVTQQAKGIGQAGAGFMVKEGLKALEQRDPEHLARAAGQLTESAFWRDMAIFSVAAQGSTLPLSRLSTTSFRGRTARLGVSTFAGMAAVQIASGRASPKDLAISGGSFLATGTFISAITQPMMKPLLAIPGPPGWVARGASAIAQLGVTLYLGEKIEEWIRTTIWKD